MIAISNIIKESVLSADSNKRMKKTNTATKRQQSFVDTPINIGWCIRTN